MNPALAMNAVRPVPRLVALTLGAAIVSHLHAAAVAIHEHQHVPAWHWALLAMVETGCLLLALSRPSWFTTRNFQLPGIFVTAMSLFILAPLPAIVRLYRELVPHATVLSIAVGFGATIVVLAVGVNVPVRQRTRAATRSEAAFPLGIVLLAAILLPIWIRSLTVIPILGILRGTSGIEAALARDAALSKLPSAAFRVAIGSLRNLYLMFAVAWMVSAMVTTPRRLVRERRRWALLAVATLTMACVYALITTERLVVGQVVLAAVVATVVARRRSLTVGQFVGAGIGLGIFPLVFGLLAGAGGLSGTLSGLRRRVLFVPGDVMMRYFIEFPQRTPFLRGSSIPKISRLTGGETFNLSQFIYSSYYQRGTALAGNANASYLGVGWANAGIAGVVMWSIVVGAALVLIERLVRNLPPRASAAARAVAVLQVVMLTFTDITRAVLGFAPGFLDLIVVLWVLSAFDRRMTLEERRTPAAFATA